MTRHGLSCPRWQSGSPTPDVAQTLVSAAPRLISAFPDDASRLAARAILLNATYLSRLLRSPFTRGHLARLPDGGGSPSRSAKSTPIAHRAFRWFAAPRQKTPGTFYPRPRRKLSGIGHSCLRGCHLVFAAAPQPFDSQTFGSAPRARQSGQARVLIAPQFSTAHNTKIKARGFIGQAYQRPPRPASVWPFSPEVL